MRQTILWSTICPVLTQIIFKEISWPEFWSLRFFWINVVADVSNSKQTCWTLCRLHTAWHLSLGSYHTETHHYPPLVVLIKVIIVKFHLKITTLKMLSDCFGIKRSRKRLTYCNLRQALHALSKRRWNVIKDTNFSHLWSIKKPSKCGYFWVLLSLYNIQDFILLAWGPHLEDFITGDFNDIYVLE